MASVNKVIIIGNLGKDPEMFTTSGGATKCTMRVATEETWTDKSGEKKTKTEWHTVVVWGRLAEICGEYLTKGREVYFEGSISTRKWEDKHGNDRYSTEINARSMQMLGGRPGGGAGSDDDVPF